MRKKTEKILPLFHIFPKHKVSLELEKISEIIDENDHILELVLADVTDNSDPGQGGSGLSAELVVRAALVKQIFGYSYEQLAFHLSDSASLRAFCRIPMGWIPNKSALQRNISKISESTWKRINQALLEWGKEKRLERGKKIRIDSTAVAADIHHPTDSRLLFDSVRTITRLLKQIQARQEELQEKGFFSGLSFTDHCRRAKRRSYEISNRRGERRKEAYRDLLKVAGWTYRYGGEALETKINRDDWKTQLLLISLEHYLALMEKVMDQTRRRVLEGETVPAPEKVFSIFEEHTDIIKKGQREPTYGHKVFLTTTASSLIVDCEIEAGNPGDSTQLQPLLESHHQTYGYFPRQIAADRGFYSGANLDWAKEQGIQDAAFDKKGSVQIEQMARSSWIYRQLTRFRNGIEGCISFLKRVFGLSRCSWKGWEHFKRYVQLSVVSDNLLVLARLLL